MPSLCGSSHPHPACIDPAWAYCEGCQASRAAHAGMCRYLLGIGSFLAGPIWGLTPVAGAMSTLYAATQPNLKGGSYVGPR